MLFTHVYCLGAKDVKSRFVGVASEPQEKWPSFLRKIFRYLREECEHTIPVATRENVGTTVSGDADAVYTAKIQISLPLIGLPTAQQRLPTGV